MTKSAAIFICKPCGEKQGKRKAGYVSWNNGICGWCCEARAVTNPEDYNIKSKDEVSK